MDIAERITAHRARIDLVNGDETAIGLAKMATACTKTIDREARTVDFVVSNATVDRDGDIVDPSGWDLDRYKQNPVVFWAHRSRDLPVGKALTIGVEGEALVSTAQFASAAANPLAEHVFQCYAEGVLHAVSAGFRVLATEDILDDGGRAVGMKILQQELWEYSAVGIPSNPDALVRAAQKGVDLKWWEEWATKEMDEGRRSAPIADGLLTITGKGVVVPAGPAFLRLTGIDGVPPAAIDRAREKMAEAASIITSATAPATDKEATNFPEEGDDLPVSFASSAYPKFPAAEAELLRANYPQIWAMAKGLDGIDFAGAPDASLRRRERDAAAAMDTDGLAGVVACVRLRLVHAKGLEYMRQELTREKSRLADEARRAAPVITISDPLNRRVNIGAAAAQVLAERKGT